MSGARKNSTMQLSRVLSKTLWELMCSSNDREAKPWSSR
jgi:hypothetical protein